MNASAAHIATAPRLPGSHERTCRHCAHVHRRGTCAEPVAAGLAEWFGIYWAPAGHARVCSAFTYSAELATLQAAPALAHRGRRSTDDAL